MRSPLLLLLGLWLLMSPGCTLSREYVGTPISAQKLAELEDLTTKAEVLQHIGPPHDMGLRLDGSVFIYRFQFEDVEELNLSIARASFDYETTDRRIDRLLILFDKEGRITGYGLDARSSRED